MSSWRKTLAAMVANRKSNSFTYDDAAAVLTHLHFELAKGGGTSHRKWRRVVAGPAGRRLVVVGLVDHGSGTLRREYLKQMIDTLEDSGILNEVDQ